MFELPFRKDLPISIQASNLLDLLLMRPLKHCQRALCICIVGRQLQRNAQFLVRLADVYRSHIEQTQILLQVSALRTVATKLNGLIHLLHSLRPILRVSCFQREVAELRNPVDNLLVLLQSIEAILILLRVGIMDSG